jgi:hypothetical protein
VAATEVDREAFSLAGVHETVETAVERTLPTVCGEPQRHRDARHRQRAEDPDEEW